MTYTQCGTCGETIEEDAGQATLDDVGRCA